MSEVGTTLPADTNENEVLEELTNQMQQLINEVGQQVKSLSPKAVSENDGWDIHNQWARIQGEFQKFLLMHSGKSSSIKADLQTEIKPVQGVPSEVADQHPPVKNRGPGEEQSLEVLRKLVSVGTSSVRQSEEQKTGSPPVVDKDHDLNLFLTSFIPKTSGSRLSSPPDSVTEGMPAGLNRLFQLKEQGDIPLSFDFQENSSIKNEETVRMLEKVSAEGNVREQERPLFITKEAVETFVSQLEDLLESLNSIAGADGEQAAMTDLEDQLHAIGNTQSLFITRETKGDHSQTALQDEAVSATTALSNGWRDFHQSLLHLASRREGSEAIDSITREFAPIAAALQNMHPDDAAVEMASLFRESHPKVKDMLTALLRGGQVIDASASVEKGDVLPQSVLNRVPAGAALDVEPSLISFSKQFRSLVEAVRNGVQAGSDLKKILIPLTKSVHQASMDSGKQDVIDRLFRDAPVEKQVFLQLAARLEQHQKLPQTYQQQHPLTGREMGRWVQETLKNTAGADEAYTPSWTGASGAMSKVEQFVLHVNQTGSDQTRPAGFLQELERMVHNSRLLTHSSGMKEMQIQLKPGSLGNMVVQVTQQNGEMIVKLMVQTLAAKELLEGNLHHLRPMFSPQQVVVEKNDALAFTQHHSSAQTADEHGSSDESRGEKEDRQHVNEEEEGEDGASFEDILMNEKV
ncbi:flagellar hook-length control protein FliK [Halobacillus kuroshimensis]|uniref:flagellar hook-length control protein FliK n=1 Tax=Halobacillus kuroshimensis TaxID=302481 RepID=UPI000428A979|nr:flagellar hook-length control protein FliK [Halobacillus kuroshimensis]